MVPGANRGDSGKMEELQNQYLELKMAYESMEKERDFYFGKLRDIEVICQESDEHDPMVQKILNILYATEVTSSLFKLFHILFILNFIGISEKCLKLLFFFFNFRKDLLLRTKPKLEPRKTKSIKFKT